MRAPAPALALAVSAALVLAAAPAGAQDAPDDPLAAEMTAPYRVHDVVRFRGMAEPIVGTIVSGRAPSARRIRLEKPNGVTFEEDRGRVEAITPAQDPAAAYAERAAKIADLERADLHGLLAGWALEHSLGREAATQLQRAAAKAGEPAVATGYRERLVDLLLERAAELADGGEGLFEAVLAQVARAEADGAASPRLLVGRARVALTLDLPELALDDLARARAALDEKAAGPPPAEPDDAGGPDDGDDDGAPGDDDVDDGDSDDGAEPSRVFRRDGLGFDVGSRRRGRPWRRPRPPAREPDDLSAAELPGLTAAERALYREALIVLGEEALVLGRLAEAREPLERVVAIWPQDPRASLALARILAAQGERAAARARLDAALEVMTGDPRLLQARAQLLYLERDFTAAAADLQAALQSLQESPDDVLRRDVLVDLGLVGIAVGDLDGARTRLETADVVPGYGPARMARGLLAEAAGDLEAAEARYREAIDLLPDGVAAEASYLLGFALEAGGRAGVARAALRDALRRGYDYRLALRALVDLARAGGDDEEEARLLELLYRASPDPGPDLLAQLGRVRLRQERTTEAAALFERGLAGDPSHLPSLRGLAWVHYAADEGERARSLFERALAIDEADPWARRGLRNLEEARTRRVWTDPFEGQTLEASWQGSADFGVDLRVADGLLYFSGKQANRAEGRTAVLRSVQGEQVVKLEAALVFEPTSEARAGLRYVVPDGPGVLLFRDYDGRLRAAHRANTRSGWEDPVDLGPAPRRGEHVLAIDVVDPKRGDVALLLDGEERGRLQVKGLGVRSARAGVDLSIFAVERELGRPVELGVEAARVYVHRTRAERRGGY